MAILSSDGTYVTVEKGDTLSEISERYFGGASNYKQLAALNNISDPNKIAVGQKIKIVAEESYQTPSPVTCITSGSPSGCPQAKLTVAYEKQTATTVTLWCQLEYIANTKANTTSWYKCPYTITVNGKALRTNEFAINGLTGTHYVDGGFITVDKESADRNISFSISFGFGISWSGTSMGTRTASGNIVIYAQSSGSSSGSQTSATATKQVLIKQFGLQSNSDNTLFAVWDWNRENTASYKVVWDYATGDGVAFVGNHTTNNVDEDNPSAARQSVWNIPSNATKVTLKVLPVSKTYTKDDKETKYWTGEWCEKQTYNVDESPPDEPNTPEVTIEDLTLTATLDNISSETEAEGIQFQVVKDNSKVFKSSKVSITTAHASYSCKVDIGGEYKVRARAYKGDMYSDWSDYSSNIKTIPATPTGITTIKANSSTSVYLEWATTGGATSYDIEYTTKKEYFDGSDQTTTKNNIEFTHYEVTGLGSGEEYFFRVRAVNAQGESAWSEIKSVIVGKTPAAPTTWSSTTKAMTGEEVILYWVHNSEDGSSQTYAELQLTVDGVTTTQTIQNTTDEDLKDRTSSYTLNTSSYLEGTKITWRVRTAGITAVVVDADVGGYGDWSVERTIDVYAPATAEISILDKDDTPLEVITEFPFYVHVLAGPRTQLPIGYHLSVTSNSTYETVDNVGNDIVIGEGDAVYSKYFDITDSLMVEFSPHNINLEGGVTYTITCVVSMDSGLTADSTADFTVEWVDMEHTPTAEISIDQENFTAAIRPYCERTYLTYYEVTKSGRTYTKTNNPIYSVCGEVVSKARTTTGELVYQGVTDEGDDVYYCEHIDRAYVGYVYLSVYRREYDGTFTEIATGLDGNAMTTVTDPHPSLDYARYRIVATDKDTGAISYYDVPGVPVKGIAVIIQWDEDWSNFNVTEEDAFEQPVWNGSMLKLPYNIDVADKHAPDVELVEYVGRAHPISYYGTQLGQTSTWSMAVVKSDKETLYGLRRLARWMGNVYVREPSGSGYWANVTVSFGQKHRELTIPVTLEVARVEGGM